VATADVEAVSVAPAQPEGDTSSPAGRAGTPEPWVARPESWTPRGVQPKLRVPHGRQPRSAKQAMEELGRVGWSDRLGSRSDCQLLFWSRSDSLGSRSDRPPLFSERSDRLGERSDR
jgi:hypothetical protein